MYNRSSCTRIF